MSGSRGLQRRAATSFGCRWSGEVLFSRSFLLTAREFGFFPLLFCNYLRFVYFENFFLGSLSLLVWHLPVDSCYLFPFSLLSLFALPSFSRSLNHFRSLCYLLFSWTLAYTKHVVSTYISPFLDKEKAMAAIEKKTNKIKLERNLGKTTVWDAVNLVWVSAPTCVWVCSEEPLDYGRLFHYLFPNLQSHVWSRGTRHFHPVDRSPFTRYCPSAVGISVQIAFSYRD